jgi:hypothetical protein
MKALIYTAACLSFIGLFCTSDNLISQCIVSVISMAIFTGSCKVIEKKYLTDEEREEEV